MKATMIQLCDSMLSNVLNFRFCLFYCNLKEKDHVWRNINSKTKIFICEINIIIILIYQKLGSAGPIQQKNKLLSHYAFPKTLGHWNKTKRC